ncbi:MAG: hypothetical protein WAX80_02910 [Minisyncoccia bacterium]
MIIRCQDPEGCRTILSRYNKTVLCDHHRKKEEERVFQETIRVEAEKEHWTLDTPSKATANGHDPILREVARLICMFFRGVGVDELLTGRYRQDLTLPRYLLGYILYTDKSVPYADISTGLGLKGHTTVMYGCDKIREKLANKDPEVIRIIRIIRSRY